MFNKRILTGILIAICIFICLSSATAQDPSDVNLTVSDYSADEISHKIIEDEKQNSLNDSNGRIEAGSKQYTSGDIQNEIDSNTGDPIFLELETYNINECIKIEKNVTIIGVKGSTVLDAKGQSSIFSVISDNVVMKNITFINAVGFDGSAIQWAGGNGSICNCEFINCTSNDWGGAIYWTGSNGSVFNCSFINNADRGKGDDQLPGGAIYWKGDNGAVFNCSFTNNSAYCGGAIFWNANNGTVFNCSFENNTAVNEPSRSDFTGRGSAIYWNGTDGDVFNCRFFKNNAETAGTLYWNSNNGKVSNSVFEDNIAGWQGGAIYWKYGDGLIFNCSFVNNAVEGYEAYTGGAIYWNEGEGNISGCRFENNHASYAAGAIYWNSGSSFISNSKFISNYASSSGGAIYWGTVNVLASDCSFIHNSVRGGKMVLGGAIYCEGSGSLFNCSFENNTADNDGGAIRWRSGNSLISGCNFLSNTAEKGGAINHYGGEGNVVECSFINNSADSGSAIVWDNVNANVSKCSFADNAYTGQGGAIFANIDRGYTFTLRVSDSIFKNGIASEGGALYQNSGNKEAFYNLWVFNSSFVNNSVGSEGSAVYWIGGNCSFDDCSFTDNLASEDGSCIYAMEQYGILSISNCRFFNNSAGFGAVHYQYGVCTIINSSFINNSASQKDIVCCQVGDLSVINSSFIDNSAGNRSIVFSDYSHLIVLGCIFTFNSAKNVVWLDEGGQAQINNNIFLDNERVYDLNVGVGDDYDANYNWFGHNATNFDEGPAISWDYIDKWLFLKAVANPVAVTLPNSSDIAFNFFVYDKNSGLSDEKYDQNLLKPVDLTLTSTKGSIDKKRIYVGDKITFTPEMKGNGSVTATFIDFENTIVVNINDDPEIKAKLDSTEANYGESVAVKMEYNPNATGTVDVVFKGKNHNATVSGIELNKSISVPLFIASDEYAVSIVYSGDDRFITKTITLSDILTVKKIDSTLTVESYDYEYDPYYETVLFRFTLPEKATGNILMNINGNNSTLNVVENGNVKDGALVVDYNWHLNQVGQYNLTAIYLGDDIYKNSSLVNATANVNPATVQIWMFYDNPVIMNLSDSFIIAFTLFPSTYENVTITSSDLNVAQVNQDTRELKACGLGNATVTIDFHGNKNYTDASGSFNVMVVPADSNATVNPVGIKITNMSVDSTDIDENGRITVSLADDATGSVTIEIDKNYTAKIDNGKAIFNISGMSAGKHDIRVYYSGDGTYAPKQLNSSVHVKLSTRIIANGFTATYKGGKYLTAVLKDAYGSALVRQTVLIKINGATKKLTTDSKGQVKLTTDALAPKNYYTATITFEGSANYAKQTKSVKIIVKKATPKLTAKAKAFKAKTKTKKYTVTLKTNRNKVMKNTKVTIKINKKTYTAKTNSKGQATFKLTKLTKKGKYTATVKYAGSKYYNAKTVKPKITVK